MRTTQTRLKVCCISTADEARTALSLAADVLGLVSAMPSGPGVIDDAVIAQIVAALPSGTESFLLTSATEAAGLIAQQRGSGVKALQLVDTVAAEVIREVRAACPGVRLIQVIHILDEASFDEAVVALPHVDALLLDSGNPRLAIKELGGSGRVHDWSLSRRIRDLAAGSGVPTYLAGGLVHSNAEQAIRAVQPFGLDVCSGVRTDGMLDAEKLALFVTAMRRVDRERIAIDPAAN